MSEFVQHDTPETEPPRLELGFKPKDSEEEITVTVTVEVNGHLGRIWEDLEGLSEGEALHSFAGRLFLDITRDMK